MNTAKITNSKEKLAAALGALVFFAPVFMEKKTEFVTFYMRQAFGLFLIQVVLTILSFIPVIGFLFQILSLIVVIIAIFLAFKAYNGERFELPELLKYTDQVIQKVDGLKNLFAPKN